MARIKEEDLRLNIIVNGDNGRKEMLDLKDSISAASESLRDLRRRAGEMRRQNQTSSAGYKALQNEIKSTTRTLSEHRSRYAELEKQMDVTKMTANELRSRIKTLRGVLDNADPGTATWVKYNAELRRTRQRLAELVSQSLATDKTLCGVATRLNQYMQSTIGIFLHVRSGLSTIQQATDRFAEYDEALVDAMKTTNLTREEIEELSERLKGLDTRTAQNELLSLARIGGKLGISGIDDLEGFVNAADKINVSLSEDLGGNPEAAIEAIGKMVDIFNLSDEFGLEQAMLKVGSAVNSLGMASTANEGYIVDFTKRLAGIAPNADISIDKILGLAATLDKYGQTSEMSSTAIGQTIMAMFSRTETFAKIAGTSLAEFSELLRTDVNEAFIRVLEGLKGSDGSLASIVANMNEMHLDGQRASQVLGTLSKNTEELRNQQQLAAEAFDEGNSILAEFETKNSSVTAVLEKQRKEITEQVVAIGQQLMPVVNAAMHVAEVGMKTLAGLVKLLMENKAVLLALTAAVMAYNVAKRVEKTGDSYTRCSLSEDGMSLVCYIALSRYPVGMGNLLKHVVEIVGDEHFPDNEKCILTLGETGIVLFPGQSDGSGRIMSSFVLPVSQYGFSAYELAVRNGFQGTEEEWLQSLCAGAMPVLADAPANPVEGQFFFLKGGQAVAVFNGGWRYALTVKNRQTRIVVGRAIPMYPEQNTAYVYPDGVLKVKIRRRMLEENGMDLSRFGKLGHAADEKGKKIEGITAAAVSPSSWDDSWGDTIVFFFELFLRDFNGIRIMSSGIISECRIETVNIADGATSSPFLVITGGKVRCIKCTRKFVPSKISELKSTRSLVIRRLKSTRRKQPANPDRHRYLTFRKRYVTFWKYPSEASKNVFQLKIYAKHRGRYRTDIPFETAVRVDRLLLE